MGEEAQIERTIYRKRSEVLLVCNKVLKMHGTHCSFNENERIPEKKGPSQRNQIKSSFTGENDECMMMSLIFIQASILR